MKVNSTNKNGVEIAVIETGESEVTKRELIDYCLTFPATYEDYPFDDTTALVRHMGNKKMFALVDHLNGRLHITLKCEPFKADFYRQVYECVIPGYHMNKEHWNTVYMDSDEISIDVLHDMIQHSFDLTRPKVKRKAKK